MSEVKVQKAVEVEKADTKLGVIVLKCLAFTPDIEDADGDIGDAESFEKAFYDFMTRSDDIKVDLDHKEDVPGKIVAGWCFPEEHLFRIAFKPDDEKVVEMAECGDIQGSSFSGTAVRQPIL